MKTPEDYEKEYKLAQSDYAWAVSRAAHFRGVRRAHYVKVTVSSLVATFLLLAFGIKFIGIVFLISVFLGGYLFYENSNYRAEDVPGKILEAEKDIIHEEARMKIKEKEWIDSLIDGFER